jgi:hypothetical protein
MSVRSRLPARQGKEANLMRTRALRILLLVTAVGVSFTLLGWQAPTVTPPAPQTSKVDAATQPAPAAAPAQPSDSDGQQSLLNTDKLNPLQKQFLHSSERGADWLFRMNGVKGRFLHGYLPAVATEMEGDHYLRQAGAAFALARAARFSKEPRFAVRATQAILALLDETVIDSKDATVRYCSLPPALVNRLGAAALLVLAINELPSPQADLLEKSEQLCAYIRRCARPDGSLALLEESDPKSDEEEGINTHPGQALYALELSQRHRPAAWKDELLVKSAKYYRTWWKKNRNMAFVSWQCAACAEGYMRTKNQELSDFVFEMGDWVCELQYTQLDPRRMMWYGGFMSYADGRAVESAPQIDTAACCEGLVGACRVARERGDPARHHRYIETLESGLRFLTTLQYTDANTQHFTLEYKQRLTGGFHASAQDGNLRIDYTQHAVSALIGYLEFVVR